MNSVTHWIAGLPLPRELVEAIQAGKWRAPTDPQFYIDTFGELPDCPLFYDLDEMSRQNGSWQSSSAEEEFGYPVEGRSAGIDPARSVLIGDLCPDMPIALDYRNSEKSPGVLYRTHRDIIVWVRIADSVSEFLARMKLGPVPRCVCRSPAVPEYRCRAADHGRGARDRPGDSTGVPGGLRGQRPGGPGSRQGTAGEGPPGDRRERRPDRPAGHPRQPGGPHLALAIRLPNVDGYAVLQQTDAGRAVGLSQQLLRQQFL